MKTITASAALTVFAIAGSGLCHAESVTYSTSASYTYFNGTSTVTSNTLDFADGDSITYDPITNGSITVPGNISYGTIDTNGVGSSASTVPTGATLTLTFTESSPTPIVFTDTATLSGMISSSQSTIVADFATTSFTSGDDTFTLAQPPGGFLVVPPSNNAGDTTVNGTLALTNPPTAPEPSSVLLLAGGLLPLAMLLKRRTRKV